MRRQLSAHRINLLNAYQATASDESSSSGPLAGFLLAATLRGGFSPDGFSFDDVLFDEGSSDEDSSDEDASDDCSSGAGE